MAKTGVDLGEWAEVVNKAAGSEKDLKKLSKLNLVKTNLKPFTVFADYIDAYNESVEEFRKFAKTDKTMMIKVAKNKDDDDKDGAKSLKNK
ncbi:variable surface protein mvspG [Ligilactobacillus pobuzihii]|uniref:variable surface protein mvspG n=1 Tax=Ligilactobacillus pobuzihii TaxID=449659 RepID=UPI0019CFB7E5|nr:variable surface protein mvspG [Ligilactobacillus pobuzihii]MBN7274911.1 variable surface protein mvspG [Ligilactobacillus pobuzihii]